MTPGIRVGFGILFLFTCAIHSQQAASPTDPDKDSELSNLLHEARALVDAKKPQPAIKKCEQVIASYKTHYGSSKSKIYCAQTSAENLAYLVTAAAAMNKGEFDADKKNAIVLSSTWSTATSSKRTPCRIWVASPKRSRLFSSLWSYHRRTLDISRN